MCTEAYDAGHRLAGVADSRANKTLSYQWSPGGLLNKVVVNDFGRWLRYTPQPLGAMPLRFWMPAGARKTVAIRQNDVPQAGFRR